jgi:hypothetical protein
MKITEDTTQDELAEALAHLVTAARAASADAKTYDIWHRRIDSHLDAWETLRDLRLFA